MTKSSNFSENRCQPTTPSLTLSSFHVRVENLEKEHQWLLKQIKRKRTELDNFVEQMRSLATEIFHRGTPSFKKLAALDQEIHTLFAEIFSKRKLGKKTKQEIEAIYLNLQLSGIISPKLSNEETDTELDELFETTDQQENDFSQESQKSSHQYREVREDSEQSSTNKTDESRSIRQTFLRLAEIFHPDKVSDSETQMRHTDLMKEINKAYQEGDIARLLEKDTMEDLIEQMFEELGGIVVFSRD